MLTITFNDKDKTTLEYLEAFEYPEYYDNANRRVLEVRLAPACVSLDRLNTLLNDPANLGELTLVNDEILIEQPIEDGPGVEMVPLRNTHDYYQVKMELSVKAEEVEQGGESTGNEVIVFRLGRYTPVEIALAGLGLK